MAKQQETPLLERICQPSSDLYCLSEIDCLDNLMTDDLESIENHLDVLRKNDQDYEFRYEVYEILEEDQKEVTMGDILHNGIGAGVDYNAVFSRSPVKGYRLFQGDIGITEYKQQNQ